MQFTLDGTTIVASVVSALWMICMGLGGMWVKRIQRDAELDHGEIDQLKKNFADFRERVALEYASRDEVRDGLRQMSEMLTRMDSKVDAINRQLATRG